MQNDSDEALARKLQKGDEAALAELMRRYTGKLLRYGERLIPGEETLGDIVQDVFVTVYQNIQDFDAARRFSPWVYRIAHNAFVDLLRRRQKEPLRLFDLDTVIPHPVYEDESLKTKEKEELRVLVEQGLAGLPPAYREVVDLYYFENFGYREIADILRIPVGTVGIRLSRARAMLRTALLRRHAHE